MKSSPGIMVDTSQHSAASWPGLSRPSTPCFPIQEKTWMLGIADKCTQSAQGRLLWPGMTKLKASRFSSDWLMHGDEFCSVRKRRFDLDVVDHFGDPIHALRA